MKKIDQVKINNKNKLLQTLCVKWTSVNHRVAKLWINLCPGAFLILQRETSKIHSVKLKNNSSLGKILPTNWKWWEAPRNWAFWRAIYIEIPYQPN